VRTRLIGLLAAGALLLGAFAATPNASAVAGATCTLVGAKVVGSSGGRFYTYAVAVRMKNLLPEQTRVVTTLSGTLNRTYEVAATVPASGTVTKTKRFSAPRGTTFTVTACSQS